MNVKLDFVLREIAGETLLVPAGKTALDLNGMLTLNETGAALWRMLPEAADAEALTQGLLQEFEGAPAEQVRADVEEFLDRLRDDDYEEKERKIVREKADSQNCQGISRFSTIFSIFPVKPVEIDEI